MLVSGLFSRVSSVGVSIARVLVRVEEVCMFPVLFVVMSRGLCKAFSQYLVFPCCFSFFCSVVLLSLG